MSDPAARESPPTVDVPVVVVVGAGPTGTTAALLLARRGVRVVIAERHATVWPLPRAVHLDDEVHRLLQQAGVATSFAQISRPVRGMRLLDAGGRVLAEFRRHTVGRHGWPQANLFDQPALEHVLRAELARTPLAALRTGTEVEQVEGGRTWDDLARVHLRDVTSGTRSVLQASAVLVCDGAAGRLHAGIGRGWRALGFAQEWLVVDLRCSTPLPVWDGISQVCDPRRAATWMRLGDDRYRAEFQLRPGEQESDLLDPEVLGQLLAPCLGGLPLARVEVLRAATYVFEAGVAERWRAGRLFLLGDAAHRTPPFIGQGLGLGLRDADNLTWKLARVLDGRAPESLLDSYPAERRAHATSLIRLAVLLGTAMTGGERRADAARRAVLAAVRLLPRLDGRLLDLASPPLVAGALTAGRRRWRQRLPGSLVPQPFLRDGRRLDDVLGDGFAVLTRVRPDTALERLAERLRAPVLDVRRLADGGALEGWLRSSTAVVLRPDRAVLLATRSRRAPGRHLARRGAGVLDLVAR